MHIKLSGMPNKLVYCKTNDTLAMRSLTAMSGSVPSLCVCVCLFLFPLVCEHARTICAVFTSGSQSLQLAREISLWVSICCERRPIAAGATWCGGVYLLSFYSPLFTHLLPLYSPLFSFLFDYHFCLFVCIFCLLFFSFSLSLAAAHSTSCFAFAFLLLLPRCLFPSPSLSPSLPPSLSPSLLKLNIVRRVGYFTLWCYEFFNCIFFGAATKISNSLLAWLRVSVLVYTCEFVCVCGLCSVVCLGLLIVSSSASLASLQIRVERVRGCMGGSYYDAV